MIIPFQTQPEDFCSQLKRDQGRKQHPPVGSVICFSACLLSVHLSDAQCQVNPGKSVWTTLYASFFETLTGTWWFCCSSFPVNSVRAVTASALPLTVFQGTLPSPCWLSLLHSNPGSEKLTAKSQGSSFNLQIKPGTHLSETRALSAQVFGSFLKENEGNAEYREATGDLLSFHPNS